MTNETAASGVITQRVQCDWRKAYGFASDPLRLPDWASGLAKSTLTPVGNHWNVDTPQGKATLRFAPQNDFGVLDHWVTPEGVTQLYMPFRVIDAGQGACEFQFTLLRQPHMDDAAYARDAQWIADDLRKLKSLLEQAVEQGA